MPSPIGDLIGRETRFRALSPLIINSNYNTSIAGWGGYFDCFSYSYPDGWFADQNYVIVKASLSFVVHAPFGGDVYAGLGFTFDPEAFDWSIGISNPFNGQVFASVVAGYYGDAAAFGGDMPAPAGASQEFNFHEHPIFVEKGKRIALVATSNANTNIVWTGTLYLLPTYT